MSDNLCKLSDCRIPNSLKEMVEESEKLVGVYDGPVQPYWTCPEIDPAKIKIYEIPPNSANPDLNKFPCNDRYHPLCCKIRNAFQVSPGLSFRLTFITFNSEKRLRLANTGQPFYNYR